MKKQTLCLIFGGKSEEYFVSLKSCACILRYINREKYDIFKIGITRDGGWYLYTGEEDKIESGAWESDSVIPLYASLSCGELTYFDGEEKRIKPDIVFPIIHGAYGEDGRLKGFFDSMNLKCLGCPTESGAVTANKYLTKLIARENSVPVADFHLVRRENSLYLEEVYQRAKELHYPLFVKAVNQGSSIGVYRVTSENELIPCIEKAFRYSSVVLMEKEIKGIETEIALLERNGEISFGKIGQIRHGGDFYGYGEKYASDKTELIVPAKISNDAEEKIKDYAKRIFLAAGCRGMCRADFFLTENGDVVFNEVNTVPGFTSGSMYPLLMAANGDISDLINLICL